MKLKLFYESNSDFKYAKNTIKYLGVFVSLRGAVPRVGESIVASKGEYFDNDQSVVEAVVESVVYNVESRCVELYLVKGKAEML